MVDQGGDTHPKPKKTKKEPPTKKTRRAPIAKKMNLELDEKIASRRRLPYGAHPKKG